MSGKKRMKSYFCSQQERVTAAVQAGQWPDACDSELRAHVEGCQTCNDVVLVAQALRQSRSMAIQAPQLPSPGLLWWRAQVRRRNAAIERVTRTIAVAEVVAVLLVVAAAVALVEWQGQHLAGWLSNVWGPLASFAQAPGLLTLGFATLVIFGGFALYLLKAKE